MKKSFILLNLILLVTLCSCGGNEYKNRYLEQGGPGYYIDTKEQTIKLINDYTIVGKTNQKFGVTVNTSSMTVVSKL